MKLFEAIEARRSTREFEQTSVPLEKLRAMVEASLKAPRINNAPIVSAIAVTRAETIAEMAEEVRAAVKSLDIQSSSTRKTVEHFSTFFEGAPALLVFTRQPYEALIEQSLGDELNPAQVNAMRGHPDILSVGAAVQNALLAATALGLQSCWMSAPLIASDAIEPILGVEAPARIAAIVAVGEGSKVPSERASIELDEHFRVIV